MSHCRLRLSRRAMLVASAAVAATARLGAAQTSRPAGDIDLANRIGPLLAAVPARDFEADSPIAFYYADLAGQLDALGIEPLPVDRIPEDLPDGFVEAALALPLASRAFQSGLTSEWFEAFGFSPLATHQALEVPTPPGIISLFAGGYDRERVETVLEASGYQEVLQETGGSYWTVGEELDLSSPVGQLGVGAMNQAVVDDELLIFARQESDIQQVTWIRAGQEPSMLEQGLWTSMVSVFSPDTVGLVPVGPSGLVLEPVIASPVGLGREIDSSDMEYLAFGVRAGGRAAGLSLVGEGTPEPTAEPEGAGIPAHVEVRIRYADPDLAEREADAIPRRWETSASLLTGQPYTELMTLTEARVHAEDPQVVAVDFTTEVPNRWVQMIHTLDLLPFIPAEG